MADKTPILDCLRIATLVSEAERIDPLFPVAEIVSAHGDPEAFGERELVARADIQKLPYGTKLYATPSEQVSKKQLIQPGRPVQIDHDGFEGDIIGHYVTREGKQGVVVQQHGTRVVHVYGRKWIEGDPS